jgi:hypothetical protein
MFYQTAVNFVSNVTESSSNVYKKLHHRLCIILVQNIPPEIMLYNIYIIKLIITLRYLRFVLRSKNT